MASVCDGTKARGTRNCEARATFLVRVRGKGGLFYGACDLHLGQVCCELLNGEQGGLEVRHIHTRES